MTSKPDKKFRGGTHEDIPFNKATEQRHHMPSQAAGNKGGKGGAITQEFEKWNEEEAEEDDDDGEVDDYDFDDELDDEQK